MGKPSLQAPSDSEKPSSVGEGDYHYFTALHGCLGSPWQLQALRGDPCSPFPFLEQCQARLTSVSPDSVVHLDVSTELPNGSHHLPDLQSQLVGGSQAEALAGEQRKGLSGLGWGTPGRDSKRSSGASHSTEEHGMGHHSTAGVPSSSQRGRKKLLLLFLRRKFLSEAWCSLFLCPSSVTLSTHTRGDLSWLETASKAGSAPKEGTGST